MTVQFTSVSRLTLEVHKEYKHPRLEYADFLLEVSKELEYNDYHNKDGSPNAAGVQAMANCFIQGLNGLIHFAHKQGYRNDAEHLRYIVSELQRGFVENIEVVKNTF